MKAECIMPFLLLLMMNAIILAMAAVMKAATASQLVKRLPTPLLGQTPCCFDRLGSLLCGRQKKANLAAFLHKCAQNADFAFVQCCRTCFEHAAEDPWKLDYKKTSEFLLTNPETARCWDRRGHGWCRKFAHRRPKLAPRGWRKGKTLPPPTLHCSNVPVAFRLCRKSCGFCASREQAAQVVYEEVLAKSSARCYSPARGLAIQTLGEDLAEEKSDYGDFVKRFRRKLRRRRRKKGNATSEFSE